jgi:hypothetical protein
MKGNLMAKAENIEVWTQHDNPHYASLSVRNQSKKSTLDEKWMLIVSFLVLPLIFAAAFTIQGSPEVLQWITSFFNSLF